MQKNHNNQTLKLFVCHMSKNSCNHCLWEAEVSGHHRDKGLVVDSWGRGWDNNNSEKPWKRPDFQMIAGGLEYIY